MISCHSTECAASEKHVPPCPYAVLPDLTPIKVAEMSKEELDALKESFMKVDKGKVFPIEPEDERMVMSFDLDALPTDQARDIVSRLIPEWLNGFLDANARYRKVGNELGYKGILPDVNRKMGVLKARVWDGDKDSGREPTRGIVLDLIGHLFLMLHMMDEEDSEELEASMSRHPAGKKLNPPKAPTLLSPEGGQVEPASSADWEDGWKVDTCSVAYALDMEDVKCIRRANHDNLDHFGRKKDGSQLRWRRDTGEIIRR